VRALAARCREKVLRAPPLAVPSVAALGAGPDPAEVSSLPWRAARARIEPFVDKLDRVERALDEAARRFEAPLSERDELRGLLQGYRSKAGAKGYAEDPALEPMYRRIETLLWLAPCDLDAARPLVREYVAAVNDRLEKGLTR
jgi:exonuclease VII small subunit